MCSKDAVTLCYEVQYSTGGWEGVVGCDAAHSRTGFRIRYPRGKKERNKKTSRKGKKLGCSRAESPGIWLETSTSDLRSLKSLEVGGVKKGDFRVRSQS